MTQPAIKMMNQAIALLKHGELIGMPTETVYGLAANAFDDGAVAKIYALKNRPSFNPLIAHVGSIVHAENLVIFDERARTLAEAFWPGPLTLVLPQRPESKLSTLATAGLTTAAVRFPAHPLTRSLLDHLDFPLVAPSANPSESISPTCADHVRQVFPDLFVLDGGLCEMGLESTILDLTGDEPVLLRPGSITVEQIQTVLSCPLLTGQEGTIKSPGQLKRHYAPSISLRLNVTGVHPGEALLSFGPHALTGFREEINLSPTGDLQQAATNLFAAMRALDSPLNKGIAVMPIPSTGLGLAINDRLKRGASI